MHECAVIGVPDDRWGVAVYAIVVDQPGVQIDEQSLLDHCREQLAGYECPKTIDLRAEALPKSGAGKILKAELRAPFWQDQQRGIH